MELNATEFSINKLNTQEFCLFDIADTPKSKRQVKKYARRISDINKREIKPEEVLFVRKGITRDVKDELLKKYQDELKPGETSIISYISKGNMDRDNEILMPKGADIKDFKQNPVVMFSHKYSEPPVGTASKIWRDEVGLLAKTDFYTNYEFADLLYQMYRDKVLRAMSIGFIPLKFSQPTDEDKEKNEWPEELQRVYHRFLLLEYSCVPVPSNAEALTVAVNKGLYDMTAKEEKSGTPAFVYFGFDEGDLDKILSDDDEDKAKEINLSEISLDENDGKEPEEPKHFERWNKNLTKTFDIDKVDSKPATFEYELYSKFFGCRVSDICINDFAIPCPLLGTYLAAFKNIFGKFELKTIRNFDWNGNEKPVVYNVIQLNSKKSDDFMVEGTAFYKGEYPVAIKAEPTFWGLHISIVCEHKNKNWNKTLMDEVHAWVKENNYLKKEKFALSGEFIKKGTSGWGDIFLNDKMKDRIRRSVKFLDDDKKNTAKGFLFVGPPGNGKTLTGKIFMDEIDCTFIWVSSRDFQYLRRMEKSLELAFSLARDLAPSVLFLEDIDGWLADDKSYSIDLMKSELDGIQENKGVLTILTSNYPEKLPDSLIDRPGRFHDIFKFDLPDSNTRMEMLKAWVPYETLNKSIADKFVKETDGFSGAYIREAVDYAILLFDEEKVNINEALLQGLEKISGHRETVEDIQGNSEKKEFDITENEEDEEQEDTDDDTFGIEKLDEETVELSDEEKELIKSEEPPEGFKDIFDFYEKSEEVAFEELDSEEIVLLPFPNEHSCRLAPPASFNRFRRVNGDQESGGKKIDVIYGRNKDTDKWSIQALRYPKGTWSPSSAKSHCKGRGGTFEAAASGASLDEGIESEVLMDDTKDEKKGEVSDDYKVTTTEDDDMPLKVLYEIKNALAEVKEGRVLSDRNRKLIKDCIETQEKSIDKQKESIEALKILHEATEPKAKPGGELDDEGNIEAEKSLPNESETIDFSGLKYSEDEPEEIEFEPEEVENTIREAVRIPLNEHLKQLNEEVKSQSGGKHIDFAGLLADNIRGKMRKV